MNFDGIDDIRKAGFEGFVAISSLRRSNCREVPNEPGVYLVLRPNNRRPEFLSESTGGHWKEQNPTVAIEPLSRIGSKMP